MDNSLSHIMIKKKDIVNHKPINVQDEKVVDYPSSVINNPSITQQQRPTNGQ